MPEPEEGNILLDSTIVQMPVQDVMLSPPVTRQENQKKTYGKPVVMQVEIEDKKMQRYQ